MLPVSFLRVSSPDSGLHSSSAPGSTDPTAEEPGHKFWNEQGQIGLPDGVNVESLFDPTGEFQILWCRIFAVLLVADDVCFCIVTAGQCCAHLRCAAWSEGVCRGEGQSLLYVDKAIDSGSTEVSVSRQAF